VIASQAIISGVFSLTQQAVQLGYLPRMHIKHTASYEIGQIYVPLANWLLAGATLGAVIGFGTSDALAGAYGISPRVYVMGQGQIVFEGTPSALMNNESIRKEWLEV
jgi:K+ transporter